MKIFLICPVRGVDPATSESHMRALASAGHDVHWPPRDTDQEDSTGLRICSDNMQAIRNADAVYVVWDGKSQGCLFDLGMAFALGKKVVALDIPAPSDGKSFQNTIRAWQGAAIAKAEGA